MTSEQLNDWVIQVMRPYQENKRSYVKGTNIPIPDNALPFLTFLPIGTIIVVPEYFDNELVGEDSYILTPTGWVQHESSSMEDVVIFYWPDGTWTTREGLYEYAHMSDDYGSFFVSPNLTEEQICQLVCERNKS